MYILLVITLLMYNIDGRQAPLMKSFILDRHFYPIINMQSIYMADCKDVNYSQEWLNSQNIG